MNTEKDMDPITVEIIRNALISAAKEMSIVLRKTSYNYIINEGQDFSVGVFNELGETLAQAPGLPEFVCDIPSAIHSVIDDIGGPNNFKKGDIYLTNDPYANTFHVHDVNAIKPVFFHDELVGFSCARAHWHDIGGGSGAGNVQATEVFQEGLILRSVRLYRAGEIDRDIVRIIRENNRLPDEVLGDIRAQVGACNIGEQRLLDIVERFGLQRLQTACNQILKNGERQAKEALKNIPNGIYRAETCLDNDGVDLDRPLPIRAKVIVDDESITIDVNGSAAWCRGPMHANKNTTRSICRLVFKMLTTPTEPANEGHFRMVDVVIPEQSIFNAKRPQGTWPGFFALEALIDVVKRALAEAMPDRVNADDYGKCTPAHIKGRRADGSFFFLSDTEGGGWGGHMRGDGENAMLFGNVRITPIELLEQKYPVRLAQYRLRKDSAGPGQWRGGLGVEKDYLCLSEGMSLNAGLDRQLCPPQGVLGGLSAVGNRVVIKEADGQERILPSKVTDHPVLKGQIISFQTAGGGGYGDPKDRKPELVLQDVKLGLISTEQAREAYGVVIDEAMLTISWGETNLLRNAF
jgi:N-methylhydantoinase B